MGEGQANDRPAERRRSTFLGIEKLTLATGLEIGSIIVAATLLYAKFDSAAAAVKDLQPRVETLERVYERWVTATDGRFAAIEQRLSGVERSVEQLDQRTTRRLERLESKLDRLLLSAPPRAATRRADDDE